MFALVLRFLILALIGLLLLLPGVVAAQSGYAGADPPSVGQPLLREGDLAVKLAQALSLGSYQDEVVAEDQLAEAGITPKNGWIADYPVTPDIIDELRQSVRTAASSGKIQMSADAALEKMDHVLTQAGLSIQTPGSTPAEKSAAVESTQPPSYQDPTVINNYYVTEGPPTVTYYAPPPAYNYLYTWVPYPFWSVGFWFPGFFILHDFHRAVFFDNRVVLVSNHFRDFRLHRNFRLDPIARHRGHNIAATRVIHNGDLRGIRDARGVRTINGTRGFATDRFSTRDRSIVAEPRAQAGRNINRTASTAGRSVELNNRGRNSFSTRESGVTMPGSIPTGRSATALGRSTMGSGRSATDISRGGMGFDRSVRTRGAGFGRTAEFQGLPNGGNRGSAFRTVGSSSFSTVRGGGTFIPSASMSRGGGIGSRGGATMSLPRQGGSMGSFSRGVSFSGMGGGRGRR